MLNEMIKATATPVRDLVTDYLGGKYFVDESFQRRLVWVEKQRVRLVETVLMGYPMPEIYLHQQMPDEENDGLIRHSIVDGQQRIKCLTQFMANEFKLSLKFLDQQNQNCDFAGCDWNALSTELKNRVRQYTINSRVIPSTVTHDEIRAIFKRLNETDKSLNPQEIRHAEFSGEFIKAAERIANLDFWSEHAIFNMNNIRRMADIEFATSLLGLLRNGITTDTEASVNKLYDLFNDKYEASDKDFSEVEIRLKWIDTVLKSEGFVRDFFKKQVHLFTLFDLFPEFSRLEMDVLTARLNEFVHGYSSEDEDAHFQIYRAGSVQRTRSKGSRELRRDSLKDFVLGSGANIA